MTAEPREWSRRQAQVVLFAVVAATTVLAFGLAVLLHDEARRVPRGTTTGDVAEQSHGDAEDQIANVPVPSVSSDAALPGQLSTKVGPSIHLPTATGLGTAEVPTGFPQTVEGAIAQLAAIDKVVLEGASVPYSQQVVAAWANAGGPNAESWSGVHAVAELLSSAGLPADGQTSLRLTVQPAMAFIKGEIHDASGEPSYVVPCVDLLVTATSTSHAERTAVADCQRMVWMEGRWVLGPGPEPSPAPSIWPGTDAAYAAGYAWIVGNRP